MLLMMDTMYSKIIIAGRSFSGSGEKTAIVLVFLLKGMRWIIYTKNYQRLDRFGQAFSIEAVDSPSF